MTADFFFPLLRELSISTGITIVCLSTEISDPTSPNPNSTLDIHCFKEEESDDLEACEFMWKARHERTQMREKMQLWPRTPEHASAALNGSLNALITKLDDSF